MSSAPRGAGVDRDCLRLFCLREGLSPASRPSSVSVLENDVRLQHDWEVLLMATGVTAFGPSDPEAKAICVHTSVYFYA